VLNIISKLDLHVVKQDMKLAFVRLVDNLSVHMFLCVKRRQIMTYELWEIIKFNVH